MFVPVVPHITVVNKKILYSDTVLSLKEVGNNLNITSIEDVNEHSLEECLKIIFESNPNVIFNTVQYSKNNKKVYFYTNEKISIEKYKESKIIKYNPVISSSEILEEVKSILVAEKNNDNDYISLYDVAKLIKKMCCQYDEVKDRYEERFDYIVHDNFSNSSNILIYGFDYKRNELHIGFNFVGYDFDKIIFSKKNSDLYISRSESCWDKKVLEVLGSGLSSLYDELIKFADFKQQKSYCIKAVNSKFLVDINKYGVDIYFNSSNNKFKKDFELSSLSYNNKYNYDCNSNIIMSAFRGKEDEIFKRIFVKINDCPKWCQEMLYEMRQNQLVEEQKIEIQNMKKQKRLELKRKIFPFLKK